MNKNKKSLLQLTAVIGTVLAAWVGYLAWCAQHNLVTLDVRDRKSTRLNSSHRT